MLYGKGTAACNIATVPFIDLYRFHFLHVGPPVHYLIFLCNIDLFLLLLFGYRT